MDTAVIDPAQDLMSSGTSTLQAATGGALSTEESRQARITLGEYARTAGIYDPVEILAFAQLCIREAAQRLDDDVAPNCNVLITEALRIASASCGLRMPNRGEIMDSQKSQIDNTEAIAAITESASTQNFVAIVADQTPVAAVPESQKRAMPPQPLGELPDIRPATLWSSSLQVVRRAASSLLTLVFARSE